VFAALSDDGARRFRPILHAQGERATDFETYLRAAVRAYFEFAVQEMEARGGLRPSDGPVWDMKNTPEMQAVFEEVRMAFESVMERGLVPRVDIDYLVAACIAVAREIADKMMERRPVDTDAAVEFVVRLIVGGVGALPREG
jgi:hypothetical protein